MTIITLPPDIEGPLTEEARKQGTTPELLALDGLRQLFVHASEQAEQANGGTLFDFLAGHIGTVSSRSTETLSEGCGRRFAEGMVEKRKQGHL